MQYIRKSVCLLLFLLTSCGSDEQSKQPVFQKLDNKGIVFRFRHSYGFGPCAPAFDCDGYTELTSDGILRVDKASELPAGTVHVAQITQEELDSAIPVLTNASLVRLLDTSGAICQSNIYDYSEGMSLTLDGNEHSHEVTTCSNQPILDANTAIKELASKYFP